MICPASLDMNGEFSRRKPTVMLFVEPDCISTQELVIGRKCISIFFFFFSHSFSFPLVQLLQETIKNVLILQWEFDS